MKTMTKKPFTVIKNEDESISVWISRPENNGKMAIVTSFNPLCYPDFIKSIEVLPYLRLDGCKEVEDGGIVKCNLTESKLFLQLIEELPDILLMNVEKKQPITRTFKGTKVA